MIVNKSYSLNKSGFENNIDYIYLNFKLLTI